MKFQILALFALAAVVAADSGEQGSNSGEAAAARTIVYGAQPSYRPAPRVVYQQPAPRPVYQAASRPRYSSDDYAGSDKYDFSWQATATGAGGYNDGYGKSYGQSAQFGQNESRDYGNTNGEYWVDLPDGRRQNVKYQVNGDSGFIAEVSYSGGKGAY